MAASTPKVFNSDFFSIKRFDCDTSNMKNEPMFFNSGLDFAYRNGGSITRGFINSLPEDWRASNCVFDSRVHMLMQGWYPAIPGWHHDDVPRVGDGQPDYDNPTYRSEHIMALVNADVSPTRFVRGLCTMPAVPNGEVIYKNWNEAIKLLILNGNLKEHTIQDRTLTRFDCDTFHTVSPALHDGWRWFGRVSRNTDRTKSITNEIRRQVQVYLEFPENGW